MSEPWATDDAIITASDIIGDALSDEGTKKDVYLRQLNSHD